MRIRLSADGRPGRGPICESETLRGLSSGDSEDLAAKRDGAIFRRAAPRNSGRGFREEQQLLPSCVGHLLSDAEPQRRADPAPLSEWVSRARKPTSTRSRSIISWAPAITCALMCIAMPTARCSNLPLAWYAEKGGYWAMNPGYDAPDYPYARRQIAYDCMFCHNAYPKTPPGHDRLGDRPVYSGRCRKASIASAAMVPVRGTSISRRRPVRSLRPFAPPS